MSPEYRRLELSTATRSRYVYLFYALLAVLFVVAVGHLYAIRGLDALYLGLPLWLWLQAGVVAVMLAVAWLAARLVTAVTGRGTARGPARRSRGERSREERRVDEGERRVDEGNRRGEGD